MRLTLVIGTLRAGGAERVMANLANSWVARGFDVTLVTFEAIGNDFYALDPRVRRVGLNLLKKSQGLFERISRTCRRVRRLRQEIVKSEAEIVVSFMDTTNLLTLLATRGLSIPVVVSERIDPRKQPYSTGMELLRRVLYRRADALVVQTQSVCEWALRVAPKCRTAVIPNPVVVPTGTASSRGRNKVVAVGRLCRQKGFDVLIEAFAKMAPRHPQWTLEIFGEGPERESLEAMIHDCGMTGRVTLKGVVVGIHQYLRDADLFVMSSRFEGFPNALLEAMACGCAAIATDCQSGPAEMIRSDHDGRLVPPDDVGALSDAMNSLIGSEADRRRLGSNASAVCNRFGAERILGLWDDLFQQVTTRGDRVVAVSGRRQSSIQPRKVA